MLVQMCTSGYQLALSDHLQTKDEPKCKTKRTLQRQPQRRTKDAASAVMEGDFGPVMELVSKYIGPAIGVLLGVIVAYFVAKFVSRIAAAPIRKRVDETLGRFVSKLVFYAIMICALLAIAGSVGINVTSFAAVLGAAGFAVGLAFQGTLGNFSSGVMLLVFRPFKVGDVISAAGITAKVHEIDLFTTKFDTFDNRRIIVPNSQIAGGTIENITFHKERRVDVSVGTDYSASLDQTREVLQRAADSLSDKMLSVEVRGNQIVLGDLCWGIWVTARSAGPFVSGPAPRIFWVSRKL